MTKCTHSILVVTAKPGDKNYSLHRAVSAVTTALDNGQMDDLRLFFEDLAPADIGDILSELDQPHLALAMTQVAADVRHDVFVYLPLALQVEHVGALRRQEIVDLFHDLAPDERADLFVELSEAEQNRVLPALAHAEREDIRRLIAYKEGTAGAVMTSDYASLLADQTVQSAIDELRRAAPDRETIYTAYVVDPDRRLIGVVSLRDLIIAEPNTLVSDLMETRVIQANVGDTQKDVARKIAKYDLIALPIVDDRGHIVGIVTADDAMDVAAAESTLAMHKATGVGDLAMGLKEATVWLLFQKRVFWLVLLVFGNIFSGAGIAYFEDLIAANVALVFFLPLLIDSGGNAGSQSATLMVRALGTGDVALRDWGTMFVREIGVAMLLGVAMAFAVSLLGLWRGGPDVAIVVSATMIMVVMVGSLVGMSLPFIFTKLKFDPASASGPLITSICDGVGVLIYFSVATFVLRDMAVV